MKRTVALLYNRWKPGVPDAVRSLTRMLSRRYRMICSPSQPEARLAPGIDAAVTLGGDGTMLSVADMLVRRALPVLGVNMGGMGYLAEFGVREVPGALAAFFAGNLTASRRAVLQVSWPGGRRYAVNDCVVRSAGPKILRVDVRVDDEYLEDIIGDGVIVATSTGSTAYSLACGGGVVEPGVRVLLLTPISPHALTQRPMILSADRRLSLEIPAFKPDTGAVLVIDGQIPLELRQGARVDVRLASKDLLFIANPQAGFFTILKRKLTWGKR